MFKYGNALSNAIPKDSFWNNDLISAMTNEALSTMDTFFFFFFKSQQKVFSYFVFTHMSLLKAVTLQEWHIIGIQYPLILLL